MGMRKNAGNALAVFVGILLLAVVFLPLVIRLLQIESAQTVSHQKSTVAFQLAEAAVAKGVAKLTETRANFINAATGIAVPRFDGATEFTDMAGGVYKVAFSPGSVPGNVLITGKGRDTSAKETRTIEAEYSGVDPDGPTLIFSHGLPNFNAWVSANWGSVKSYDRLNYFMDFPYPRLYAAGSVRDRDEDPAPPNSDNTHYWAYQKDMGSAPVPDLAYYKEKAKNSVVPSSSTTGAIRLANGAPVVRNPPNSGYFESALNVGNNIIIDKNALLPEGPGNLYEFRSSTSVIYFDIHSGQSCYPWIYRAFLEVEALIGSGEVNLINSAVSFQVFGATIPDSAPAHYQGNKVWINGFPTAQTVWAATYAPAFAQPTHCCYSIPNLQVHGYVWSNGLGTGGAKMLGVVQSDTGGSWSSNTVVYYDPNVLRNIVWTGTPLYQYSWKETASAW